MWTDSSAAALSRIRFLLWSLHEETNEHIIECQSPKNRYKRETRLSAMSSRAQQVHVRKCVSSAWLQYIKHILAITTKGET